MVSKLCNLSTFLFFICRSSLTNQNETSGSYLLGGKGSSIIGGNIESSIRPPTSTESLHGAGGLSGSTSSPSLLSSSNNQIGIGSSGLLNESTSAIEGKVIQIFLIKKFVSCHLFSFIYIQTTGFILRLIFQDLLAIQQIL